MLNGDSSGALRFALVGCGRIAKRHSELLGMKQIANATLVAVCDVVAEKAERIGEQFRVPWFTDMHAMMKSVGIDVVVVLTESGSRPTRHRAGALRQAASWSRSRWRSRSPTPTR